jgi:hypothetical protein
MNEPQDILALLEQESWLGKTFLFFAAVSAILVPISWFTHGLYVYLLIFPMGLAWMFCGFALFIVLGKLNVLAMFGKHTNAAAPRLPNIYWYCLGVSLVYCVTVFFSYALSSPQGVALGPTADLRIFAAVYLSLNLGAFGFAHFAGASQRNRAAA